MKSNQELNKELAILLNEFKEVPYGASLDIIGDVEQIIHEDRSIEACYIDYCDSWERLMPLAIENGVFFKPLAWERTGKLYRAYRMDLNENSEMTNFGTKFICDDENPERAVMQTLIKVLKEKQNG